jgi:cysteine synthase
VGGFAVTNESLRLRPRRCEVFDSVADGIGNTPLVQIHRCLPDLPGVEIFAKLETFNPGGSSRDRLSRPVVGSPLAAGSTDVHARTTAREIYDQTCGRMTHLVADAGPDGALAGILQGLRRHAPLVQGLAVSIEPSDAPAMEGEGIDRQVGLTLDEAEGWVRRLAREEGLLVGTVSGAVLAGAVRMARVIAGREEAAMIVVIFADGMRSDDEPVVRPPKRPAPW